MLLNIAKAYEILHFSESKANAHNEVISVLLSHAQRHLGKFLFWMLLLELHEKTLGSQNYAYVFLKNEMNIFLIILLLSRNYKLIFNLRLFFFFSFFLVTKNKFPT